MNRPVEKLIVFDRLQTPRPRSDAKRHCGAIDPADISCAWIGVAAWADTQPTTVAPAGKTLARTRTSGNAIGMVDEFSLLKLEFQPMEPLTTARLGLMGAAPNGNGILPTVAGGGAAATRVLHTSGSMRYATFKTEQPLRWASKPFRQSTTADRPGRRLESPCA